MPYQETLFGTLSANGNTTQFNISGGDSNFDSGFFLTLTGTFGSGTVQVQYLGANGTWINLTGGSFTAATDKKIELPNGKTVRLNLSGATSPSIYWEINAAGRSSLGV